MGRTFAGETKDASAPIIGAGWWKKGTKLAGFVTGVFETQVGKAYNLALKEKIKVPGEFLSPAVSGMYEGDEFSVGALKGFVMALRASGANELQVRDWVEIECTGATETGKGNDRVDFKVKVNRP